MNIRDILGNTPGLKQWLVENENVPDSLTDDDLYVEAGLDAFLKGTLTIDILKKLVDEDDDSEEDKEPDSKAVCAKCKAPVSVDEKGGYTCKKCGYIHKPKSYKGAYQMSSDPEKLFGGGSITVKDASEQYSEERYTLKNKHGERMFDPIYQSELMSQSQASKARHGVLLKHLANKSGLVNNPLTEHEKSLLTEICETQEWCGKVGGEHYDAISPHRNIKALIDDSTSGGLEITPIEFDRDIITFPLLNGELYPQVDLKPVPRGRRIEGASIGTPTMSWGGGDNASISIFNTASFVAAIDTTIFAIDGCIEVGRDFLSDSPVNVGEVLTGLVGERLMEELDEVVANGDGTTQPEGLFQASGVSTVTPDNTTTGPPTLDDYYDLLFATSKQYRKPAFRPAFVSNDTTYARSRKVHVDPATPSTDQRPVLAPVEQVSTYMNLGYPHKIQNDLANGTAGFFCLSKYRMYRRLGLEIRWVEGGRDLARRNMMLLVYRARFGGRLMDANAGAKWTNGQS